MAKKERAPKKEKPTKYKEILKKSEAERRENRKSKGITAIITVVIVLLLIGIGAVVGLVVKDNPAGDSSDNGTGAFHNREWVLNLLLNYDSTVAYLTEQGYVAGIDFEAEYDAAQAENNDGLVGSIKSSRENGSFEIYYFAETANASAGKNAQTYYNKNMANKITSDSSLDGRNHGKICFAGKGELFQTLFWQYYIINQ